MKFVVVAFAIGLFLTIPGMILLRLIGLESVVQCVPVWLLPEGHHERMKVLFLCSSSSRYACSQDFCLRLCLRSSDGARDGWLVDEGVRMLAVHPTT